MADRRFAPVQVTLGGHLTREALERALAGVLGPDRQGATVVVDCRAMTSYELDARSAFVEWSAAHRSAIRGVAVLTDKPFWHLVIRAMSLASGQRIRPFATLHDATEWLDGIDREKE